MSRLTKPTIQSQLIIITCIFILLFFVKSISHILGPILLAFLLTIIVYPAIRFLKRFGIPNPLAVLIVITVAAFSIGWLLYHIFISLNDLVSELPTYMAQFSTQLDTTLNNIGIHESQLINQETKDVQERLTQLINLIRSLFPVTIFLFYFFLILIMMLATADTTARKFAQQPSRINRQIVEWTHGSFRLFIIQTGNNIFTSLLVTGLFLFLRIDYAILWGVLAFVLSYIPNIGIIIASIPPVFFAYIQYGLGVAVLTGVMIFALNQLMDSYVTPKMIGHSSQTQPVIILISFLFWIFIFGPIGAFIYAPITLAVRTILENNPNTKFLGKLIGTSDAKKK